MSEAVPGMNQAAPRQEFNYLIALVVAFAFFMENLDSTIITTAVPQIARALGETPLRMNVAMTSYILSLAVFIPVSGWIADKMGMRQTFCTALVVFSAGSMLCGLAQNLPMLVVSRIFQGFGGAMMTPVGRLILLRSFPRSDMVRAASYVAVPAMLGPTMGPVVGGLITSFLDWRWIFYVNVPFGVIGFIFAMRYVKDYDTPPPDRFDWPGFFMCGIALALTEFGIENLGHPMVGPAAVVALFVGAAAILAVYVVYSRRRSNAVLDLKLLRVRTFRASISSAGLTRISIGATPFLVPLMMQVGFGLSPVRSGMITMATSMGALTMRTMTSRMLRRWGFRKVLVTNSFIVGCCTMVFTLFTPRTPHLLIFVFLLAYGMVRAGQFGTTQSLTFSDIPSRIMSKATSMSAVAQQMSQGLGVSVGATVLGIIAGPHTPTVTDFHWAFVGITVLTLLPIPGYMSLKPDDGWQVSGHVKYRDRLAASAAAQG